MHQLTLRTLHFAPVRLFGWTLDNKRGVTAETLGINGAQANVMLNWDEKIWETELASAILRSSSWPTARTKRTASSGPPNNTAPISSPSSNASVIPSLRLRF